MEQTRMSEQQFKDETQQAVKKPYKTYSIGNIQVSVWENTQNIEGTEKTFFSISVQRGYKDRAGNWHNVTSFGVNDLPKVSVGIQEAYRDLLTRKKEE